MLLRQKDVNRVTDCSHKAREAKHKECEHGHIVKRLEKGGRERSQQGEDHGRERGEPAGLPIETFRSGILGGEQPPGSVEERLDRIWIDPGLIHRTNTRSTRAREPDAFVSGSANRSLAEESLHLGEEIRLRSDSKLGAEGVALRAD